MQDGCNVYMDSYMALNGSCFVVTWIISCFMFQKPPFGGRPNTNRGDHGTMSAHNPCFILFYHNMRTRMNRNPSKWHLVEGSVTYDVPLHSRVRDPTA